MLYFLAVYLTLDTSRSSQKQSYAEFAYIQYYISLS